MLYYVAPFLFVFNGLFLSLTANFVSVNIEAKWSSTPLLCEASEFFARESAEYFWLFIDDVVQNRTTQASILSDRAHYELARSAARRWVPGSRTDMLDLILALRIFSPAVRMNHELALSSLQAGGHVCGAQASIFVEWQGRDLLCDVAALEKALDEFLKSASSDAASNKSSAYVYLSDKIHPGFSQKIAEIPTGILYADLRSAEMVPLHRAMSDLSRQGKLRYVYRHFVARNATSQTRLSGYGAELAIKSTEYKAVDDSKVDDERKKEGEKADEQVAGFLFSTLKARYPAEHAQLDAFREHLLEQSTEIRPVKVWQLQDMSLLAAQRVLSVRQDQALAVLRDIAQNYPQRAAALAAVGSVNADFRAEMQSNQQVLQQNYGISPGETALLINGQLADLEFYDVYSMFEHLGNEARLMDRLYEFGLRGTQLPSILSTSLSMSDASSGQGADNGGAAAASTKYALDIRDPAVTWLNDLETDQAYKNWPSSVQELLRHVFPGMLRQVAKNIFHLLLIVDPGAAHSRELLKYAEAFVLHSAPMRVGLLWSVPCAAHSETDCVGRALVEAFNYVKAETNSLRRALSFLTDVFAQVKSDELTEDEVRRFFTKQFKDADVDIVFGRDSDYKNGLAGGNAFMERTALGSAPHALINGVPLESRQLREQFEEAVVNHILEQTTALQKAVYYGHLTDHMNPLDYIMQQSHVVKRLNRRILSQDSDKDLLEIGASRSGSEETAVEADQTARFHTLSSAADRTGLLADSLTYLTKQEDVTKLRPVSMWLVANVDNAQGRLFFFEAFKHLKSSATLRLALIHSGDAKGSQLVRAIHTALRVLSPGLARSFVAKLLKEDNVEALMKGTKTLRDFESHGMDMEAFEKAVENFSDDRLALQSLWVRTTLASATANDSIRAVLVNGQLVGPLLKNEQFLQQDFALLERLTAQRAANRVSERLKEIGATSGLTGAETSDLVMRVSALLLRAHRSKVGSDPLTGRRERKQLVGFQEKHSVLRIYSDLSRPVYDVVAVLDPLTRDAQKMSHILIVLSEALNCQITVIFNCKDKLSEAPLKSFYRYVLFARPEFNDDGSLASSKLRALFNGLPGKPLLTLGLDAPHNWMLEPVHSPYDLDNIRLDDADSVGGVLADFELEHMLLEGHCVDLVTQQPPRGLEFTLGTRAQPVMHDTIVMANLGYFQLKARPGAWFLRLREGKSRDIYDMAAHEYTDSEPDSEEVVAVIDSFRSKIIRVKVSKKANKLDESLLGSEQSDDSLWGSLSSAFGGSKKKVIEKDDTLNIFSVASGHLYERFLRIMMLSVLKHTKSRVKFWFLKNYLSPTFIQFIPHMAAKYGFEYELVQYRWPRWLRAQSEKQRVIWGYKILFLDVLFPLHLKRVIFVDADQIVRTDLQELADMDIGGAPYAYTPFCNSRKEMDGFRFWKSGYWAQHLSGRPYHISALYLIDLVRFRRLAAGDRLRGQYQGLSQDPNSLANLDQDLPNNMIHQVPIFSLPQEWLYCETWCSESEKAAAKTIDLCNNPLTKEPKLSAAKRIVPEWSDYDREIRGLQRQVAAGDKSSMPLQVDKKQADTSSKAQSDRIEL